MLSCAKLQPSKSDTPAPRHLGSINSPLANTLPTKARTDPLPLPNRHRSSDNADEQWAILGSKEGPGMPWSAVRHADGSEVF